MWSRKSLVLNTSRLAETIISKSPANSIENFSKDDDAGRMSAIAPSVSGRPGAPDALRAVALCSSLPHAQRRALAGIFAAQALADDGNYDPPAPKTAPEAEPAASAAAHAPPPRAQATGALRPRGSDSDPLAVATASGSSVPPPMPAAAAGSAAGSSAEASSADGAAVADPPDAVRARAAWRRMRAAWARSFLRVLCGDAILQLSATELSAVVLPAAGKRLRVRPKRQPRTAGPAEASSASGTRQSWFGGWTAGKAAPPAAPAGGGGAGTGAGGASARLCSVSDSSSNSSTSDGSSSDSDGGGGGGGGGGDAAAARPPGSTRDSSARAAADLGAAASEVGGGGYPRADTQAYAAGWAQAQHSTRSQRTWRRRRRRDKRCARLIEQLHELRRVERRVEALCAIVTLLLHCSAYDAHARALCKRVASALRVPWPLVAQREDAAAALLRIWLLHGGRVFEVDGAAPGGDAPEHQGAELVSGGMYQNSREHQARAIAARDSTARHSLRVLQIGAATLLGATALAVTGGFAAPALASGLATLGASGGVIGGIAGVGSGVVSAAGGTTGMIALFGAGGGGLAGVKMVRRTKGIEQFEFHPLRSGQCALCGSSTRAGERGLRRQVGTALPIVIYVSGWLRRQADHFAMWGWEPEAEVDVLLSSAEGGVAGTGLGLGMRVELVTASRRMKHHAYRPRAPSQRRATNTATAVAVTAPEDAGQARHATAALGAQVHAAPSEPAAAGTSSDALNDPLSVPSATSSKPEPPPTMTQRPLQHQELPQLPRSAQPPPQPQVHPALRPRLVAQQRNAAAAHTFQQLVVREVIEGGSAALAGVRVGDVIMAVNGTNIDAQEIAQLAAQQRAQQDSQPTATAGSGAGSGARKASVELKRTHSLSGSASDSATAAERTFESAIGALERAVAAARTTAIAAAAEGADLGSTPEAWLRLRVRRAEADNRRMWRNFDRNDTSSTGADSVERKSPRTSSARHAANQRTRQRKPSALSKVLLAELTATVPASKRHSSRPQGGSAEGAEAGDVDGTVQSSCSDDGSYTSDGGDSGSDGDVDDEQAAVRADEKSPLFRPAERATDLFLGSGTSPPRPEMSGEAERVDSGAQGGSRLLRSVQERGGDDSQPACDSGAWPMEGGEQHALQWESTVLKELGHAMVHFDEEFHSYAVQYGLMSVGFMAVVSAVAMPISLVRLSDSIDNPWVLALNRACDCGGMLAEMLLSRPQGARPVTLVGYSIGARLIFECMLVLADRAEQLQAEGTEASERQAKAVMGLVENAVLLGAAVSRDSALWRRVRTVVAGRLINGYSETDWTLRYLFRFQSFEMRVAGIAKVSNAGVENADLSSIIHGHREYPIKMRSVLRHLKLES